MSPEPTADACASERAVELADELSTAALCFVELCDELAPIATDAVRLDAQYHAALAKAGSRDRRPPMKDMLAEIVLGKLGALRPSLPYVPTESAKRSQEVACGAPVIEEGPG